MTSNTGSTSSTGSTTVVKNAAKGNQQGQTTLAAKVSRWEVLINNLSKDVTETPKFKALLDPFTAVLNEAKGIRDQQVIMKADRGGIMTRRQELIAQGNDLFGRLQHLLKGDLGPQSDKLHAFGLKPSQKVGRKRKSTSLTTVPPAATPSATPAPVTTPHSEPQK